MVGCIGPRASRPSPRRRGSWVCPAGGGRRTGSRPPRRCQTLRHRRRAERCRLGHTRCSTHAHIGTFDGLRVPSHTGLGFKSAFHAVPVPVPSPPPPLCHHNTINNNILSKQVIEHGAALNQPSRDGSKRLAT